MSVSYVKTGGRTNYVSPDRARRDRGLKIGTALRDWADKSERVSTCLKAYHMTVGAIEVASLIDNQGAVELTVSFILPLGFMKADLEKELGSILGREVAVTPAKSSEVDALLVRDGYYRL
jgi:hypothetical protein